jgi:hypothetical protein
VSKFVTAQDLAGSLGQSDEELQRLVMQLQRPPVLVQRSRVGIQLESRESTTAFHADECTRARRGFRVV